MAKNVMKMLKPSPKRGKNAFDLSHRHVLGASFGELLPITTLETVPGDYFEINCADLLRAMPMVTSPFMRAKQHIDFWFVPYTDLWHQFNAFITSKVQPQSSALHDAVAVPHVNLARIQSLFNAQPVPVDIHNINWNKGFAKLYNLLGYGDVSILPSLSAGQSFPDINLWRIAAYNYIWYNEYRQQYYDDGTRLLYSGESAAKLFNFDDLTCSSYSSADLTDDPYWSERLIAMFQMRYRCWKKDLYTGMLPSTQFGAVSAVNSSIDLSGIYTDDAQYDGVSRVYNSATGTNLGYVTTENSNNVIRNSSNFTASNQQIEIHSPHYHDLLAGTSSSSFDVLALRRAQAIQIWRENALRSGNRVNDNMRGHFGEVPSYQRDHRPTYIGSYDAVLNISDVNSTAQVSTGTNQQLGDVAGKGLSSLDSKKLKFQCNDFGVIMGIFSLLPEAEYNSFGIDRTNQLLDRYDYFSPEMENLGLEAISTQNFLVKAIQNASIMGYAPRYFGYKTKLDKVFGNFQTSRNLQIWCSPKFDVYQAMTNYNYLLLSTLYVNPKIFDVNFVADAQTIGEQFLCDFFFDVESVRPMTVLGLPTE